MHINAGLCVSDWGFVCVVGLRVWRLSTVCWRPDSVRISICARISSRCCSERPVWAALKASAHCCPPPLEGCVRPWKQTVRARVGYRSHFNRYSTGICTWKKTKRYFTLCVITKKCISVKKKKKSPKLSISTFWTIFFFQKFFLIFLIIKWRH